MAIPDYQSIMLPLLRLVEDGRDRTFKEALDSMAQHFALSQEELAELLPSGNQGVFTNRVGWAKTYLRQAGLLDIPRRGLFRITARGKAFLASRPRQISTKDLEQFPDVMEFKQRTKRERPESPEPKYQEPAEITPDEAIESAYQQLRDQLAQNLLSQIKACSPAFFERTVVDLLLAMGYGGSRQEAGATIGKPGDGGIDGIIKEDKLGLDVVYIQAKRWEGTVGSPEI